MIINLGPAAPLDARRAAPGDRAGRGGRARPATRMIGYLHTGIEKQCENKTYCQGITLTDRMDYLAPLFNNLAYTMAVEELLGIEAPGRGPSTCA